MYCTVFADLNRFTFCRKDQFAVLNFLKVIISTDPGLRLGDPAPLNGLSLWTC